MKSCATSLPGEAIPSTRKVSILVEYCKGCGLCIASCKDEVLELARQVNRDGIRVAVVKEGAACRACGRCYAMCPDAAITIDNGAISQE